MSAQVIAVDHFAGTGWAVACQWLGIREYGVEIMKEAIFTRRIVGFRTIYRDVWSGLFFPRLVPFHDLYIASPPCQTFSVAGRGTGRKALEQVLGLIASGAWKAPEKLRAAGAELGDDRTALVLTPLAHIWAHRPRLVALEQVPTVLPVWEAMAEVLRGLGYSVWTGNLQAEQYGVPQTRKRAILMARLDGPVAPPVPTHSRYYSREPQRLDPGVQKWVSMAEALGWGMTGRPYPTIATGTEGGGTDPAALGGSGARRNVYAERAAGRWAQSGVADNDKDGGILRLQAEDAAELQTFPSINLKGRVFTGQNSRIAGGETVRYSKDVNAPAPTITGQARSWRLDDGRLLRADQVAVLQSYPMIEMWPEIADWRWVDAPATTIAGDPRITAREHHFHGQQSATALKLEPAEAARFQTFPAPFPFQGSKGKQFLQIGNAVPPLLAYAILGSLIGPPTRVRSEGVEPIALTAAVTPAVSHSTSDDFTESRVRAVKKAEQAFARAEARLAIALEKYDREVAAHEERGDGFFPESYITTRHEAVLARKVRESKRSALATARAQMTAARLGDL